MENAIITLKESLAKEVNSMKDLIQLVLDFISF